MLKKLWTWPLKENTAKHYVEASMPCLNVRFSQRNDSFIDLAMVENWFWKS